MNSYNVHSAINGNLVEITVLDTLLSNCIVAFANQLEVTTHINGYHLTIYTKTQNDARSFVEMLEDELGCTCKDCWGTTKSLDIPLIIC